jgi:hypothetical protein
MWPKRDTGHEDVQEISMYVQPGEGDYKESREKCYITQKRKRKNKLISSCLIVAWEKCL